MQGNHLPLNSQAVSAQNDAHTQMQLMKQNVLYSIKRRLETLIALGEKSLQHLQQDNALTMDQQSICYVENSWVQLDDALRLVQNDWEVLEWLNA